MIPIFDAYFIYEPIVRIRANEESGKIFYEKAMPDRIHGRTLMKREKISRDGRVIGALEVEYSVSDALQSVWKGILIQLTFLVVFFATISWVLILALQRKFILPLESLRQIAHANETQGQDFSFRVQSKNEIADLAGTLEDFRLASKRTQENLQKMVNEKSAQLVQSSKLSSLGEMAAGIAHEINNPMAIIVGNTEVLKSHVEKHNDEYALKRIEKILNMVQRVTKIINGLRQFSRNAENDPPQVSPLSKIIGDTVELCKQGLLNKQIAFELKMPEQEVFIKCREVQISQVLLNLIQNAADAIAPLADRWIQIKVDTTKENRVKILVIDSGKGISQEIIEKLFQPFFTTKEVGKGTGLGLSISMGIAKDHGGSLSVDTQAKNTCFVLELPLKQVFETENKDAA